MDEIVILIPAYKPSFNLITLVDNLIKNNFTVVVVDDGSGDEYKRVFNSLNEDVNLVTKEINKGKGSALKTGLEFILTSFPNYTGIVTADADGQHTADDIIKVSQALIVNQNSLILGSRGFSGHIPIKSFIGNKITKFVFTLACGKYLKDTQTGLRAFNTALVYEMLNIVGEKYEYETNVLLWSVQNHIPIKEIEIDTIYIENNSSSHFNTIKDSVKIYSNIFKFTSSSILAFFIDFTIVLLLKSATSILADSASLLVSVLIARIISSSINFFINKAFVFKHRQELFPALLKYYGLAICILCANYSLIYFLYITLNIHLWIAKIITEIILFTISYFIQKRMIFKERK